MKTVAILVIKRNLRSSSCASSFGNPHRFPDASGFSEMRAGLESSGRIAIAVVNKRMICATWASKSVAKRCVRSPYPKTVALNPGSDVTRTLNDRQKSQNQTRPAHPLFLPLPWQASLSSSSLRLLAARGNIASRGPIIKGELRSLNDILVDLVGEIPPKGSKDCVTR